LTPQGWGGRLQGCGGDWPYRTRREGFAVEIQFTRIVKTFYTTNVERDALEALLDEHMIGESGESLADRMEEANGWSTGVGGFWEALASLGEEVGTESDFSLEEDVDDDEDDDDDTDDDEDDDTDEDDLVDVDALLIDA
jgi:hypothetical protein